MQFRQQPVTRHWADGDGEPALEHKTITIMIISIRIMLLLQLYPSRGPEGLKSEPPGSGSFWVTLQHLTYATFRQEGL